MSKSILVIDTPKSCSECRLKRRFSRYHDRFKCNILKEEVKLNGVSIHPQCPLQDTTELLEVLEDLPTLYNVNKGNVCVVEEEVINKLHKALGGNNNEKVSKFI